VPEFLVATGIIRVYERFITVEAFSRLSFIGEGQYSPVSNKAEVVNEFSMML